MWRAMPSFVGSREATQRERYGAPFCSALTTRAVIEKMTEQKDRQTGREGGVGRLSSVKHGDHLLREGACTLDCWTEQERNSHGIVE
jgi:hypothetical protein